MPRRHGSCINFGLCDRADAKEILGVEDGQEFECPACGKPLARANKKKTNTSSRWRGLVAAAVLVGLSVTAGTATWFAVWQPEPRTPTATLDEEGTRAPNRAAETVKNGSKPSRTPQKQVKARKQIPALPAAVVASETTTEALPGGAARPSAAAAPAVEPVRAPVVAEVATSTEPRNGVPYDGPTTGLIVWEGHIGGTDLVTIDGGRANVGTVLSGQLPGVPVLLQPLNERMVTIAAGPSADNQYRRLVMRLRGKGTKRIAIRWSLP